MTEASPALSSEHLGLCVGSAVASADSLVQIPSVLELLSSWGLSLSTQPWA